MRRRARSTTSRSTTPPDCSTSRTWAASSSTRCTRAAATSRIRTTCSSTSTRSSRTPTRTCSRWGGTSRSLLDQLGLTSFPKTSGATGLQIFVPILRGTYTHDTVRAFVGAAGRMIKQADPDRVTMAWKIADRTGKIFIDHNMNRSGANISAAYSVRPELRAPVSTPLTWDEVFEGGFEPQDFRIDNVWDRFERLGDLFDGVRTEAMDLTHALEALGVVAEEEPEPAMDAPLPRTAAPSTRAKTSEEVAAASKDPALFEYVRRRDFGPEGTTEPAPGDVAAATGNSFVIHKHRATRLHYDVRLEKDGALPSWAVPKGLPTVKGDKRLAVRTEDHPLEYGSFEGTIPEGHYGAGEVRIFDDGWYEPVEWTDSKVSFILHGRRYPGLEFHFVKTRTDWLAFLASAQIGAADPGARPVPADAGRGWMGGVRRRRVVVRTQARRDPVPRRPRHGRDHPADPPRPRRHGPVPRAAHGARAGRPGERRGRRRDRGLRRAGQELVRGVAAADEPAGPTRDRPGLEADPGRPGRVRPAVARRARHHGPRPGAAARAARAGRGGGPAPAGDVARRRATGSAFTESARALELEGVVAKRMGSTYLPGRRSSGLAQDQAHRHPGLRDPGVDPGPRRARHLVRRAARGRDRRPMARCAGSGRWAPASPTPR